MANTFNVFDHCELSCQTSYLTQQVKIPGKLYIAGEYAVLEAGQPAIIVAIDAYLSCHIKLSSDAKSGSITSTLLSNQQYNYYRSDLSQPGIPVGDDWPVQFSYILSAIEVVESLILSMHRPLQNYHLTYNSELVSSNGDKYGLGSSGAVTIATIKALLLFYGLNPNPLTLYKLAAIASIKVSNKGSLGDIAASSFKGWVYYQSPDREWLQQQIANGITIEDLLSENWPQLQIESLTVPNTIQLLIGWTQSPASTDQLVNHYQGARDTNSPVYHQFIEKNRLIVNQLSTALIKGDIVDIQTQLSNARYNLKSMTQYWGIEIETAALKQFVEIAQSHQFEAKTSGAGGGDCGIAIGSNQRSAQSLLKEWIENDITPLPRQIAY